MRRSSTFHNVWILVFFETPVIIAKAEPRRVPLFMIIRKLAAFALE